MNRQAPAIAVFMVAALAVGLSVFAFRSGDYILMWLTIGAWMLGVWNFRLRRKAMALQLGESTSLPHPTFRVTPSVYGHLILSFVVPTALMWAAGWLERPYAAFIIVVAWVACFSISSSVLVLYREFGPGRSRDKTSGVDRTAI